MTGDEGEILTRIASQTPREWLTDGATLMMLLMLGGRAWHALQQGGGLVGVWRALVYGTNTPHRTDDKPETKP